MDKNELLQDVLSELTGPLLLIGADKRLCYASPAFRRLSGMVLEELPCDALLLPARSGAAKGHCCWDVLDVYLVGREPALWQLRDSQDGCQPVLCDIRPIEVGRRMVMIAVTLEPLRDRLSPTALSFFRCLRRATPSVGIYEESTLVYLKDHYGLGFVKWLDDDGRTGQMDALSAQLIEAMDGVDASARRNGIYDVMLSLAGSARLLHVFETSPATGSGALVVGNGGTRLDSEVVCVLRAATAVRAEHLDPPAAGHGLGPAVMELFSHAERDIIELLRQGLADKEIAVRRGVSVNTVRNQVRSLMRKAGVNKRTRLVATNLAGPLVD